MSPQKIKSPASQPQDIKARVISCLNKLSDRDTLAVGASELESIALTLTPESFSPFLACIHGTDDSSKSPVRRQCVQILALLSHSHGHDLSPQVSKMAAIIVRRLRDPDSAVRAACVAAAAAIAGKVTRPPFSALLKPLTDALTTEQDANSQIGAAMCIAAAVEAAPGPEKEHLRRLLPRAGKLLRSEGFKAKASVLGMVGTIVGSGGVVNKGILEWLVPLVIEFLSSADWTARKAAAETLGRMAATERELAAEHKASCLKCLEARRFDKVKIVRETINRSLELWKDVANAFEDVSASSRSSSSSPSHDVVSCFPSLSKSSHNVLQKSSESKKPVPTSRSSSSPSDTSPGTITKKESPQRTNVKNLNSSISSRLERKQCSNWKIEDAVPHSFKSVSEHDAGRNHSGVWGESENKANCRPETKRSLLGKFMDEKVPRFGAFKSGSRVAPFSYSEKLELESGVLATETSDEDYDNEEEMQDLAMLREQLAQIENQQFCLFELLQKFIGSSQSGMNSLETRVEGLEMALEGISFDLGLSSGRSSNGDSSDKTCCMLPGADFLSSKVWRKAEGQYSTSGLSSPGSIKTGNEAFRLGRERFWNQSPVAFAGKVGLGDYSSENSQRVLRDTDRVQFINSNRLVGTSPSAPISRYSS